MNLPIQKQKQELQKSTVNSSTELLLSSIKGKNSLEIDRQISHYRRGGCIAYENLLMVPVKDRLPGLVEQKGMQEVHSLVVIMVTKFCNAYNVIRPMSAEQIVECAIEILNSAEEDFLSVEDLAVFFAAAKTGKYGKVFDRLDQQVIFEMLELYRQERHENYFKIKQEQENNLKSFGPSLRSSDGENELKQLFHKANLEYYKTTEKEKP